MKKPTEIEKEAFENMIIGYGRRRLYRYADSIRELASSLTEKDKNLPAGKAADRKELLWQKKILENKGVMVEQLCEMADIMTQVAEEAKKYIPMGERRYKQIAHVLKENGIQVKNIYMMETPRGQVELSMELKTMKSQCMSSEEIGDLVGVLLNLRLTGVTENPFFAAGEWKPFCYVEAPAYHVLTGVAKAVKETEKISGDNYAFLEEEPGKMTVLLSDGMGSGDKACSDSAMIVELMEKFLEAGFNRTVAISMINNALLAAGEQGNMSTLDLCSMDLYSGYCEFIKVGSSSSFIKRDNLVERISAGNLPLGIFQKPDMEMISRQLQDGDYLIFITDGILDALSQGIGEDMLSELISGTKLTNPGEMASAILNFCIHQCKGHIRDDMTVLVVGLWKSRVE